MIIRHQKHGLQLNDIYISQLYYFSFILVIYFVMLCSFYLLVIQKSMNIFIQFLWYYYMYTAEYIQQRIMQAAPKDSKVFHSMMRSPSFVGKSPLSTVTTTISVPFHRIQEQIELYQWRSKNSHQVISYQWIRIEAQNEKNVTFTLRIPQKLVTFEEIKIIRGTNVFKNISKIFESFLLLYEKFGPFEITPKMIAYDTFLEPYTWMNEDFRKNQYKRDLISQTQFAANILFLILKHDHKFQNSQLLDYCCQIKGQGFSLKQISNFFNEFHQRELQSKRSKIMKIPSPQSTLCFSKQSKIKKHRLNKDFKGLNTINAETYRSLLKNSSKEKEERRCIQRTSSLTQIKGVVLANNQQQSQFLTDSGSGIKINILKESDQDYEQHQRKGKDSFLPIHEQLQISIDYENQEELEMEKQEKVIQFQQLDKFKKFLAKSIITGKK